MKWITIYDDSPDAIYRQGAFSTFIYCGTAWYRMVYQWGKKILSHLEQLGLHRSCPICARQATTIFCQDCYYQLMKCQQHNGVADTDPPLFAWGCYAEMLKQALSHLKYRQQADIAQPLGRWLGLAWLDIQQQTRRTAVMPIPLHPDRQRARGYNQAALIARSFCHTTGLTLVENGLVRVRPTEAQFNLGLAERILNVEQAFRLGPVSGSCQRPILLLDDIYTTGATVSSAAQTLRSAGYTVIGTVTVAQAM